MSIVLKWLVPPIFALAADAVSVWAGPGYGMVTLFAGSMAIFPLTQLVVRGLGSQVAFTVPLNFLLVGAATLYRTDWFFPAAMIVVGTHYLPFVTLYGMRLFALLALYGPPLFSLGGWITGGLLVAFAFFGRTHVLQEERRAAPALRSTP